MLMSLKLEDDTPEKETPCTGMVFSCVKEAYIGSQGDINFKTRLRPVRSLSCKNKECGRCQYLDEFIREDLSCSDDAGTFKDGKYYSPIIRSWQSYEGEWDAELDWVEYTK